LGFARCVASGSEGNRASSGSNPVPATTPQRASLLRVCETALWPFRRHRLPTENEGLGQSAVARRQFAFASRSVSDHPKVEPAVDIAPPKVPTRLRPIFTSYAREAELAPSTVKRCL
jgi:hypothetical protein